jgi:hypothetical protein
MLYTYYKKKKLDATDTTRPPSLSLFSLHTERKPVKGGKNKSEGETEIVIHLCS